MTGDRVADPAVEAAKRSWDERHPTQLWDSLPPVQEFSMVRNHAIAAAREALAPLRDIHRPFVRPASYYGRSDLITVCNHCLGPQTWPCLTARYIYAEDELAAARAAEETGR